MQGNAKIQLAVLEAIGKQCLTIDQIEEVTELNRRQVSDGAAGLITRGHVERIDRGCFQLTESGEHCIDQGMVLNSGPFGSLKIARRADQRETLRLRAWKAMRMDINGTFTVDDIALTAAREGDKNPIDNLQKYFRVLHKAGYLFLSPKRAAGTKPTSPGFKRYRLIRDTGEHAPVVRKKGTEVFDHNLREVFPCE